MKLKVWPVQCLHSHSGQHQKFGKNWAWGGVRSVSTLPAISSQWLWISWPAVVSLMDFFSTNCFFWGMYSFGVCSILWWWAPLFKLTLCGEMIVIWAKPLIIPLGAFWLCCCFRPCGAAPHWRRHHSQWVHLWFLTCACSWSCSVSPAYDAPQLLGFVPAGRLWMMQLLPCGCCRHQWLQGPLWLLYI